MPASSSRARFAPFFVCLSFPLFAGIACGEDDSSGTAPGLSASGGTAGKAGTGKGKGGTGGDPGAAGEGGTSAAGKGGSAGKNGAAGKAGAAGQGGAAGKGGGTSKGGSSGSGGGSGKGGKGGSAGSGTNGGEGGSGDAGADAGGNGGADGGTGGTDAGAGGDAGSGGSDPGGAGGADAGAGGSAGNGSSGAAGSDPGPCVPEPDTTFCKRYNAECGSFVGSDNCGTTKSVPCGTCEGKDRSCGGGGMIYTCGLLDTDALPGGTAAPNLLGVWASSPKDAWAVGDKGTVVHYDGVDWKPVVTGLPTDNLKAIWGFEGKLWVAGALGLYHFDGATWAKQPDVTSAVRTIWGVSGSEIYAGGDLGQIYRFDGSKWTDVGIGNKDTVIRGLWKDASGKVAAVGDDGHTGGFNGSAWAVGCCDQINYYALHGSGNFGIAGATGTVRLLKGWTGPFPEFESLKISGATFSSINTSLVGVFVEDETRAWAVGTGGAVVHSGPTREMTWYQVSNGGNALRSVWGAGNTTFVVGDKGTIRLYKN